MITDADWKESRKRADEYRVSISIPKRPGEKCEPCEYDFSAGYIAGLEAERARGAAEIQNLKMICRRLAAAQSIEMRDKISKQCLSMFKGSILREGKE